MEFVKNNVKHVVAVLLLALAAVAYFKPVLQGKEIFQSDIAQFKGMSQELKNFRETYGKEAYWTDAAFGGMPAYQLSAYYPENIVKKVDSVLRFLPHPADYLFLYFLGFYGLLVVLKVDVKLATLGAIAFGLSTYLIIILGVGHNAKAHAIAYMPFVISGVLCLFDRKYIVGFTVLSLAFALELQASHPQMTYYMLFMLGFVYLFYFITQYQQKQFAHIAKIVGFTLISLFIGFAVNATSILATKEYASQSTRGNSELTITANGAVKEASKGLSKDYITEYSYGISETINLIIPRAFGGSNNEPLSTESNIYQFLVSKVGPAQANGFIQSVPMYWGDQPIVAAPAYVGVGFVFLAVLGFFFVKGWFKNAVIATVILALVLSWGKNFGVVTNFFIDYVPLYNKFRAVSSIQVLLELLLPVFGLYSLQQWLVGNLATDEKISILKKSVYVFGGFLLAILIVGYNGFSFQGANDAYFNEMIPGFSDAFVADRKAVFLKDTLRSLGFVVAIAATLFLLIKQKIKQGAVIYIIGVLLIADMYTIATNYVNDSHFMSPNALRNTFVNTPQDDLILQDKSHYRVANLSGNFMNDGLTSYKHKSIGGYHAAKLGRYQELADFYLVKNNMEVYNMLNTKYFIVPTEDGNAKVHLNDLANGNAWYVSVLKKVTNANQEIMALENLPTKTTAVVDVSKFAQPIKLGNGQGEIKLTSYLSNQLQYQTRTAQDQLAVFSEIYYQPGWNAYIDDKLTTHLRVNYVLRALEIPKGTHQIVFKFEPTIIEKGTWITRIGYALFVLVGIGIYFFQRKK